MVGRTEAPVATGTETLAVSVVAPVAETDAVLVSVVGACTVLFTVTVTVIVAFCPAARLAIAAVIWLPLAVAATPVLPVTPVTVIVSVGTVSVTTTFENATELEFVTVMVKESD